MNKAALLLTPLSIITISVIKTVMPTMIMANKYRWHVMVPRAFIKVCNNTH